MTEPDYIPAARVEPDPVEGWSAADLSPDELVDDEFIAANSGRVYEPLMPDDERRFRVIEFEQDGQQRTLSFEMRETED